MDIYYHNGISIILPLSVGTLAAKQYWTNVKNGRFGTIITILLLGCTTQSHTVKRLISAGALDEFDLGRTTMLNTLDDAIK